MSYLVCKSKSGYDRDVHVPHHRTHYRRMYETPEKVSFENFSPAFDGQESAALGQEPLERWRLGKPDAQQ